MDQWDPMKEAYENKHFNTYNEGVGRDLSGNNQQNKGVRLYVQNIPTSLGKAAFYNLFAEYGTVLHHYLKNCDGSPPKAAYGFITMENLLDAETAIRKLNQKKLGQNTIRVSPALSEEEKNKRKKLKQDQEAFFSSVQRDTTGRHSLQDREQRRVTSSTTFTDNRPGLEMDRGDWQSQVTNTGQRDSIGRGNSIQMSDRGDGNHHTEGNLFLKMGMAREAPYSRPSSIYSSSSETHVTSGLANNTQDHYQGAGRGIFKQKNIITPPPSVQALRVKLCVSCYKEDSVHMCSRCRMYYCSGSCQQKDWPRHKEICATIGEMLRNGADLGIDSTQTNHKSSTQNYSNSDTEVLQFQMREDRKMKSGDARCFDSDSYVNETKANRNYKEQNYFRSGQQISDDKYDQSLNPSELQNISGHFLGNTNKTDSQRFQDKRSASITGSDHTGRFQNVSLQNNRNSPVESCLSNDEMHRYPYESALPTNTTQAPLKFNTFSNNIKVLKESSLVAKESISKISHEKKEVIPINSNQKNQLNNITEAENSKRNIDSKCQGTNKTLMGSPNYQNKIEESIRSPDQQNGDMRTRKAEDTIAKSVTSEAINASPSILELSLAVKTSGQCYLTYFESPYKFWISLQEFLEAVTENMQLMEKELPNVQMCSVVGNKVGGTYGVMYMGEWCRATILSIKDKEVTVYFLDHGNQAIVKPEDLRPLSKDMLDLPAQAICCCVSKVKPRGSESWTEAASAAVKGWFGPPMSKYMKYETLAKGDSLHAVNISINNVSMREVLLSKGFAEPANDEPGLLNLMRSRSKDQNPPRHMACALASNMNEKKNGDKISVVITDIISLQRFIVLDLASSNFLNDLTSLLQSEYANSTASYRPVKGELVAAKFLGDGNWYRAEVTAIDGDSCTLFYVDYGNSEVQTVENIRSVTKQKLIDVPKQALPCSLVVSKPLTEFSMDIIDKEFYTLLASSVSNEEHYILHVQGKTRDTLLVDVVTKSGASQSAVLTQRLLELSSERQHQGSSKLASKSCSVISPLSQAEHSSLAIERDNATNKYNVAKSDLVTEKLVNMNGKLVNVLVSFVKSPAEFYVQLSSKHKLFTDLMIELNGFISSSPTLPAPSVGSLTVVQFSQDSIWYRGLIEKIEGNKCVVYFIDYGNSEEALLSNLRVLPSSMCSLPAQAIKCHLEGKLENLARTYVLEFNQQLDNKSVDVKVCGSKDGSLSVQVFLDGTDISPGIQDVQLVSPVKPTSTIQHPASAANINMEVLPDSGEPIPVMVTHVDSCSRLFISVVDNNTLSELCQVMVKLNELASHLPHLNLPVVGSVCAAQYSQDGTWYRARVVKICDTTTCIVQFVDYGNSEESKILNLRELESTMTKLPGQAICCCLFGFEPDLKPAFPQRSSSDTTELIYKLRADLLEKKVCVKVVDKKLDTWIIKMENELGECISKKFMPPELQTTSTPKISDLIYEDPSEKEFMAFFSHINTLSDFYCHRCSTEVLKELQSLGDKLREDISKFVGAFHGDPVVNGVYASKFEGMWYRCVVEEVKKPKVLIRYIDYGNSEEIPANQLRPLSPESLLVPVRLFRCKLHGVTPVHENWNSPEMAEYLEILQQSKVDLVIEGKEKDTFLVSFVVQGSENVSVTQDLVDIGLAKFSQAVSPQKEVTRPMLPYPQKEPHQTLDMEDDEEEDDQEMEIQRKIHELQLQLKLSQQKKKNKH